MNNFTYLALGDSYTIGEQVAVTDSFPCQTIKQLRKRLITSVQLNTGRNFNAPEIIAKTGWTTDELLDAIDLHHFLPAYDFVSLLIGVNNQYRGKNLTDFENDFEILLKKAIEFAANNNKHVFVLSIPDWGATPFAAGRDTKKISAEIDTYNAVCKNAAEKYQCIYLDITNAQRPDANQDIFLAADRLHPSGKEYAKWALQLVDAIQIHVLPAVHS